MNKIVKYARFVFALVLVFSALGLSTSPVQADQPYKYEMTLTWEPYITNDLCPFPIEVTPTFEFTGIVFFDKNGAFVREFDHVTETDIYTANGKTLTSLPFTYNMQWIVDSSGNLVHEYVSGVAVKVALPDGRLFIAAGRLDVLDYPGATFFIPDKKNINNLDGFCAALAP